MKRIVSLTVVLTSIILYIYGHYFFSFLLYFLFIYYNFRDIIKKLYVLYFGIPYPSYQFIYENISQKNFLLFKKLSIVYLINFTKYSIEDMNPLEFWGRIRLFFNNIIFDKNFLFHIFLIRNKNKNYYFIKFDFIIETDFRQNLNKIISAISTLLNIFKSIGIDIYPINYSQFEEKIHSFIQIRNINLNISMLFIIITFIINLIFITIINDLYVKTIIISFLFLSIITLILRMKLKDICHVRTKMDSYFILKKNYSLYNLLSPQDIYEISENIYRLLNSHDNILLHIVVKRESVVSREEIGKKAFRLYDLGTALDKLSLIAESKMLYEIVDKRLRKGEQLFSLGFEILCNKNIAKNILSLMDSIGLYFSNGSSLNIPLLII